MQGWVQGQIDRYLSGLSDEELLGLVRRHVMGRITPDQKRKLAEMVAQEAGGRFEQNPLLKGLGV